MGMCASVFVCVCVKMCVCVCARVNIYIFTRTYPSRARSRACVRSLSLFLSHAYTPHTATHALTHKRPKIHTHTHTNPDHLNASRRSCCYLFRYRVRRYVNGSICRTYWCVMLHVQTIHVRYEVQCVKHTHAHINTHKQTQIHTCSLSPPATPPRPTHIQRIQKHACT